MTSAEDQSKIVQLQRANAALQQELAAARGQALELDAEVEVPSATVVVPVKLSQQDDEGSNVEGLDSYNETFDAIDIGAAKCRTRMIIAVVLSVGILVPIAVFAEHERAWKVAIIPVLLVSLEILRSGCEQLSLWSDYRVTLDSGGLAIGFGLKKRQTMLRDVRVLEISRKPGVKPWFDFKDIQRGSRTEWGMAYICRDGPTIIAMLNTDLVEFSCADPERFTSVLTSLQRQELTSMQVSVSTIVAATQVEGDNVFSKE